MRLSLYQGVDAAMADTDDVTTTETVTDGTNGPEGDGSDGLNDGGKKALTSERAARREAERTAKALQEQLDELLERDKSDLDKATSALAKATKKADEADAARVASDARLLRYEIAAEQELTGEALELLSGNTREEIEASAARIKAVIEAHKPSAPVVPEEGSTSESSSDDAFARGILLGR